MLIVIVSIVVVLRTVPCLVAVTIRVCDMSVVVVVVFIAIVVAGAVIIRLRYECGYGRC